MGILELLFGLPGVAKIAKRRLIYYSLIGHLEIVKLLLDKGADVNVKESEKSSCTTALSQAAQEGHLEIVKLLLDKGADANAIESWQNMTALMWAEFNGYREVADLLRKKTAVQNGLRTVHGGGLFSNVSRGKY